MKRLNEMIEAFHTVDIKQVSTIEYYLNRGKIDYEVNEEELYI